MKKSILIFLLSATFSLTACAPSQTPATNPSESTTSPVSVWTETSATKVLRDESPKDQTTLKASAAKGEQEGAQIIVRSDKNIAKVEVMTDDLAFGGHKIPKANIDVYRQHYFDLQITYDENQKKGWYPDALVPFDASAALGENKITKNQNFGIWFTFKIPEDAVAGLYKTNFTIVLDGQNYSVPAEVQVYDFTLPAENHVKTAFALWIDDLCDIWGNQNPDVHKVKNNAEVLTLIKNYTAMLSDYRISTTALPLLWGDLENAGKVVEAAKEATQNPKIASYSIPVKEIETSDGISKNKLKEIMTALIKASTNEVDLLKKAYLYIPKIDEPLYQGLIPLAKRVNEIVEEIRSELLADSSLWNNKESVRSSLQGLQHVLTADYDSRLFGTTQTWCPYFSEFDTQEKRDLYYNRRDTYGEGLWWYGCVGPKYPYPTYHMNNNVASARTIGWMQKVYQIDGQLYWTVNLSRQMKEDNLYHVRDIWTDAYSFYNVPGDGYLVYPGAKYGIDTALPSIRLEAIRDGFEDYEYLYLLEQLLKSLKSSYPLADLTLAEYVQHLSDKLFTGTIPTLNDSNIFLAKNELADLITLAQNDILVTNNGNRIKVYAPTEISVITANGATVQATKEGDYHVFEFAEKESNVLEIQTANHSFKFIYTK